MELLRGVFGRSTRQRRRGVCLLTAALAAGATLSACSGHRGAGEQDAATEPDAGDPSVAEVRESDVDTVPPLEALAPLPPAPESPPRHGVFMGVQECNFCHTSTTGVLQDSANADVSPGTRWQASMMALSARDPYWLAQLSHELVERPEASDTILDVCTRCHLPAGNEAARAEGRSLAFEEIVAGTDPMHHMAREGVTCTVCHQISDEGLGTAESYVGGYVIGENREIWGPHSDPFPNPMQNHLDYTPTESDHIMQSAFCASCHTVITHPLGANGEELEQAFPEQVPYLEWLNSTASASGVSCQDCHASRLDQGGNAFTTVLSMRPGWLDTQREVGDHGFIGGNAYMLELFADNRERTGAPASEAALRDAVERSERFLETTASVSLTAGPVDGEVVVSIINHAGHKFPTAYPTRRAWLEVVFFDESGAEVFHSGGFDDAGYLLDGAGERPVIAPIPHHTRIDDPDDVQVYEGVMADVNGEPTHTLLSGFQWWKDNRLLPAGWDNAHEEASWTTPVGVGADADFRAGSDQTTYVGPSGAAHVVATLWYQTLSPNSVDALHADPTPASVALSEMTATTPPRPRRIASAELTL